MCQYIAQYSHPDTYLRVLLNSGPEKHCDSVDAGRFNIAPGEDILILLSQFDAVIPETGVWGFGPPDGRKRHWRAWTVKKPFQLRFLSP